MADAEGKEVEFVEIERFKFYEDAKKAFAVVSTGETAFYANLILKKVRRRARGTLPWLLTLRLCSEGASFRRIGSLAYCNSQPALEPEAIMACAPSPLCSCKSTAFDELLITCRALLVTLVAKISCLR